jgi:hypothetical protein
MSANAAMLIIVAMLVLGGIATEIDLLLQRNRKR